MSSTYCQRIRQFKSCQLVSAEVCTEGHSTLPTNPKSMLRYIPQRKCSTTERKEPESAPRTLSDKKIKSRSNALSCLQTVSEMIGVKSNAAKKQRSRNFQKRQESNCHKMLKVLNLIELWHLETHQIKIIGGQNSPRDKTRQSQKFKSSPIHS